MKLPNQLPQVTNEDQLQATFYTWAWNTYPQFRRMMWAVPNGASRNPIEASKLKAMGVLAGVWDLHCYGPNNTFAIIECKFGTNDLTRDRVIGGKKSYGQFEWGEIMAANGAQRYVCRDLSSLQSAYRQIFRIPG